MRWEDAAWGALMFFFGAVTGLGIGFRQGAQRMAEFLMTEHPQLAYWMKLRDSKEK